VVLDDDAGERLRAWIETRTKLVTGWEDQPQTYTPDGYIYLRMGPMVRIGQDGIRYTHDPTKPAGQDMIPTVVGQREFVLTVEVRAESQELSEVAEVPLSQLELALQLPSFQQLLLDLNLGLVTTGPIMQTDAVVDERVQSRAAMDIRFATSIHLTDADEGQSYIATAEVETTLQGGVGGDIVTNDLVGDV
jgi:hypothetical protein